MLEWLFGRGGKKKQDVNDLVDENGKVIQKSSIVHTNGKRYLSLKDDECGLVMHPGNNVQIIFTKLYDKQSQSFTEQEQFLMALVIHMQQPGFTELLVDQLNKRIMKQNLNINQENEK